MIRSIVTGRTCVLSRSALPGKDDLQAMWRVRLLARPLRPEALGVAGPLEDCRSSSVHRQAPRRGIDLPLQSMQEPHDGAGWAALALRRGVSPCAAKVDGPASGLGTDAGP
jgi:hypothetical protein